MSWSNAFSYGPNNTINFDEHTLLQLVGKNGHGKSSIPLILEEALFNKNSKGIKKANILNRYGNAKQYSITVEFDINADRYQVKTTRGSTQSVSLHKNGVDISSHTSTGTYKLIEEVLGYDHKTFCQIIYQSDAYSLEFLTSTDTIRKKFLIDLLNLTKYTDKAESIKDIQKAVQKEVDILESKIGQCASWISQYASEDLTPVNLSPILEVDTSLYDEVSKLDVEIATCEQHNQKVTKNNTYKSILESIEIDPSIQKPTDDILALKVEKAALDKKLAELDKVIKGVGPILTKCPSCGQAVDHSHKAVMLKEAQEARPGIARSILVISDTISQANAALALYQQELTRQQEWEKYHRLYDPTLPSQLTNKAELETQRQGIKANLARLEKAKADCIAWNTKAAAKNARIEVIISQKDKMTKDYEEFSAARANLQNRLSNLQVLSKAFSTSGLVAYKIECSVKDLEDLTNNYLLDMSDGRFQINFVISSSDKLDVVITDNGVNIDINALSNGELARVNISTLLGIRKLMESLSSVKTNLLILDETIESLDGDGKEKLVEVLLRENYLNTMIVSHGFTHPLLHKVHIVKEQDISRIET